MERPGTQNKDGVYLSVTTSQIIDNRSLGAPVKDGDGYYVDIPAAVIGIVSRNKTRYDAKHFIEQITSPESSFNKRLCEGVLGGELGHPEVDMRSQGGISRLLNINPQKQSHHIRTVKVKKIPDLGLDVVTMDAKGAGPYGYVFDESMADPTRNTAFSLRGLSQAVVNKATGIIDKKLIALTTFDMVVGGGFAQASKRYMQLAQEALATVGENNDFQIGSCEVLDHILSDEDLITVRNIAVESFTDTELNEIVKANRVIIGSTEIGFVDKSSKSIIDQTSGKRLNPFATFVRVK
jgi:Peptidase S80 family